MAEGLTFTVGGKGVLGDVEPGWSEQEFATPVNPNERAGGTGTVSFAAKDVAAGVLAINKAITCTYDPLGSVAGIVRTTSKTGQRVTVTHDNNLARYNATRNMPPMVAASPYGVMSLAEQILGIGGFLTAENGALWQMAGHLAGFDGAGNLVANDSYTGSYAFFVDGSPFTLSAEYYFNRVEAIGPFVALDGRIYSTETAGSSLTPWIPQSTSSDDLVNSVAFKSFLNGENLTFSLTGGPPNGPWVAPAYNYGQEVEFIIDPSVEELSLTVDFSNLSSERESTNQTVSLSSLDLSEEIAVFFEMSYNFGVGYSTKVTVCNTSDYATTVVASRDYLPFILDRWFDPWAIQGNVRSVWQWSGDNAIMPVAEYEAESYFAVTGTQFIGEPSIGFVGSVWDWLQDFCSAYGWEIYLNGDVPTIRRVNGLRVLDVSSFAPSPTITPTSTRTGRSVNIVWNNGRPVNGELVYDAREDDNRILSVGAAQTTVTKIKTNAYLTSILPPTRVTTFIPGAGTYYVIDSTGLPIVADQWEDYGGRVDVAIDSAEAGIIAITITGPSEEIPSTTAPYSLAVSDGQNQYAALSILGSGIVADPQTLNLLTGANPDITPQEVAFTVNNAFINTEEQAYDSGIWAAVDASGPRVEYTINVPTSALSGFGLTAGALINAEDSTYRVTSATVGRTSTSITAVRHATVQSFDDAWSGETVGDHDTYWDGFLCEDQRVFPYAGTPAATIPNPAVFP